MRQSQFEVVLSPAKKKTNRQYKVQRQQIHTLCEFVAVTTKGLIWYTQFWDLSKLKCLHEDLKQTVV